MSRPKRRESLLPMTSRPTKRSCRTGINASEPSGAFWSSIKKMSVFWSSSILLLVFVLIAVTGVMAEYSTLLMVVACTAALAWWDLANFEQSIVVSQPLETLFLLERHHLQSLAMAVSGGLILAFIGSFLNLQISFIGTVLLVSLAIGCLTHALLSLEKKNV